MLQSGMQHRSKFIAAIILAWFIGVVPAFAGDNTLDRGDVRSPKQPGRPEPTYKIQAAMDGEIYPVFANFASLQKQSDRNFGVLSVAVSNNSEERLRQRIAVRVVGWSDQEIQIAELPPGGSRT